MFVTIYPQNDNVLDFDETVTLTLVPTNGYLVVPGAGSQTAIIHDDPFIPVLQIDSPVATDYHAPSDSLLVSANEAYNEFLGVPTNNFFQLKTNLALSAWSTLRGQIGEVKMVTVRTTTNGFSAGEMFFSADQPGRIGKVSGNGSVWTSSWVTLPGETNHLRGSLHLDQTGLWGNNLIAVAGEGLAGQPVAPRSVWSITANRTATLITRIDAQGLEGALTLPNDPRYGPWAGKLLTSDENEDVIYALDTNGSYTAWNGADIFPFDAATGESGLAGADFDLVATNQDLYCTLQFFDSVDRGLIVKVPRSFMSKSVGDILVTRAGETTFDPVNNPGSGKLFFLHWDAVRTNFVAQRVLFPLFPGVHIFEHSTFAPCNINPLSQ